MLKIERYHGNNAAFDNHHAVKAAAALWKRSIAFDKHDLIVLLFNPAYCFAYDCLSRWRLNVSEKHVVSVADINGF